MFRKEHPKSPLNFSLDDVVNTLPDWEIMIWGATGPYPQSFVVDLASRNPSRRVLVMLGFEFVNADVGDAQRKHFKPLFDLFPVVVRQHATGGSLSISPPVFEMPLGYMRSMFAELPVRRALRLATNRTRQWAFVGDANKSDRKEMIAAMSRLKNGKTYNVPAREVPDIYGDAVFVPIGRGNVNTNCFRIYEAAACGAIPVMVVPALKARLFHHGHVGRFDDEHAVEPPFVFLSSWEDAGAQLTFLLHNSTALLELQSAVVREWERMIVRTQEALFC